MKTSNTITVSFDKSDFKDLLILEMVNHMKENWEDNQIIDLFLDSDFNFVASNKTKAERVKELISQHKSSLVSNVKIDL
jgi:cell division protein FtsX